MAAASDFRRYAFDVARIDRSGKSVARQSYWRLYAIENLLRVVIHSVLQVQLGPDWWLKATTKQMRDDAEYARQRYLAHPWHGTAGTHPIYFTFLSTLSKIMANNKNQFLPVIPDIDNWIVLIEMVLLPRNIVGHMNWLSANDRKRIDVLHSDLQALIPELVKRGLALVIAA